MIHFTGFNAIVLLLPVLLSCSQNVKKDPGSGKAKAVSQAGNYYPAITCVKDSTIEYALYLPTGYSAIHKLPLVIFFDPHAKGTIPVEKYRELGEKYQVILAGSNNSRNNQPPDQSFRIFSALLEDLLSVYQVNPEMVFTAGFSGGARVAGMIAFYHGGIRGVIACGAGIGTPDQSVSHKFDYLGIVGNADFNMWEMRDLDNRLQDSGLKHHLIIFSGTHEWPPAEVFEKGMEWHLIHAMDDRIIPENVKIRTNYREGIKELEKLGLIVPPGPADESIRSKELEMQKMLQEAFFTKDMSWWEKEVKALKETKGIPPTDTLMNRRLAGYLGILCYSLSNQAVSLNKPQALEYVIMVYEMIEPRNSEIPKLRETLKNMQ